MCIDNLPNDARTAVYGRLLDVLSGRDQAERFRRLAPSDRDAILEILRDTKPELSANIRQAKR